MDNKARIEELVELLNRYAYEYYSLDSHQSLIRSMI